MNMKQNAVLLGLACLLGLNMAGLGAQTPSGEKVKADVKQTVADVKTYAYEKKADFEKRIKAELDDLDAKIEPLRKKTSELTQEGKKKGRVQLKKLEQKRKDAGKKLDTVKAASDKEWVKFKAALDKAVADLKKTYEDFKANLK